MSAVRVITEELASAFGEPIYCHLTIPTSEASDKAQITLYVTGSASAPGPLGSLVYAIQGNDVDSTIRISRLFQSEASIDNAERIAQAIVKRFHRPAIVGSSLGGADGTGDLYSIIKFVEEKLRETREN